MILNVLLIDSKKKTKKKEKIEIVLYSMFLSLSHSENIIEVDFF